MFRTLLALLSTLVLLVSGCVPLGTTTITQPESPLIPGTNTRLSDTLWWLSEGTHQGEPIAFEAISPLWVQFTVRGELLVSEARCNAGGYQIIAKSDHQYRLFSGVSTAVLCSDRAMEQSFHLREAFLATTRYELRDNQVFLLGEETQIILVDTLPENPWTIGAGTDLLEKGWRLAEVTYQGEVIDTAALQPLLWGFASDGYLRISSPNCYIGSYEIFPKNARQYDIAINYHVFGPCVDAQTRQVMEVLDLTTEYEIKDGQLFLMGDNVQIILAVDNNQPCSFTNPVQALNCP